MAEIKHSGIEEMVRTNVRYLYGVRERSRRLLSARQAIVLDELCRMEKGETPIVGVDIERLAVAADINPMQLLKPLVEWPECETCSGWPPAGFACKACGAEGETA